MISKFRNKRIKYVKIFRINKIRLIHIQLDFGINYDKFVS